MKLNRLLWTSSALLGLTMMTQAQEDCKKRATPEFILKVYDQDGDGSLNMTEKEKLKSDMQARRSEMISQYDSNGDGQLDESEKSALKEEKRKQALESYDTNLDGKLSKDERKTMIETLKSQQPLMALRALKKLKAKKGDCDKEKCDKESPKL